MRRIFELFDELRDIVRESPGLRSPRSRTVILKACRRAVMRRSPGRA